MQMWWMKCLFPLKQFLFVTSVGESEIWNNTHLLGHLFSLYFTVTFPWMGFLLEFLCEAKSLLVMESDSPFLKKNLDDWKRIKKDQNEANFFPNLTFQGTDPSDCWFKLDQSRRAIISKVKSNISFFWGRNLDDFKFGQKGVKMAQIRVPQELVYQFFLTFWMDSNCHYWRINGIHFCWKILNEPK